MGKSEQLAMPGFEALPGEIPRNNSVGSDRWYYLYKPLTDEMMIIDDNGNWAWTDRDTINNTPHLFNTRTLVKQAQRRFPQTVITRYKWAVK